MIQAAQDIQSNPMLQIFQKQQPVTLVYREHCSNISDALEREKLLNAMSPAEKIAFVDSVNPDWTDVADHRS